MAFFNQHSFTLSALVLMAILGFFLLRDGVRISDLITLGALGAGLLAAYVLFLPGPSTLDEVDKVEAQIGAGKVVLLEFQSPY